MSTAVEVIATLLVYNQRASALAVLAAVKAQTRPPARIIVVDNASPDGSADAIAAAHPDVTLIRLPTNQGVGAGHNAAWAAALADPACRFLWVLEHDSLPTPTCLEELLCAQAGLVEAGHAPDALVLVPTQVHDFVRDPRPYLAFRHATYRQLSRLHLRPEPWIPFGGASFNVPLYPAAVVRRVGRLNPAFFVYCEDTDYARRAIAQGIAYFVVPRAQVEHNQYRDSKVVPFRRFVLLLPEPVGLARAYYGLRNTVYTDLKFRSRLYVTLRYSAQVALLILYDLFAARARRARLRARLQALRDGLGGRMGEKRES